MFGGLAVFVFVLLLFFVSEKNSFVGNSLDKGTINNIPEDIPPLPTGMFLKGQESSGVPPLPNNGGVKNNKVVVRFGR